MNPTLRLAYNKLRPTPIYVYYGRRVLPVAGWFSGMIIMLGWPFVWSSTSNKLHNVPNINGL
ncbi:uncharacterized protein SPAPADRAFT_62836 [Spathaspora passalidarum NRRL Y-27907]|uniref:Uncharacterized protein n=1 Tax=Spathaspora passalidarum (strain NRRL Y-27907 / 11-Y1) TaxID=619300 RepID=G3ATF9_SPAPN|nr:uncharacterized protein SPAPADRAFT_62836 [Spathaspora passalidarum NRRL Y-27907]EGW30922.1 hypothetical protein SPAPADRAFT_62836 [Spathaspora passalidarum NRRL Y-27907]